MNNLEKFLRQWLEPVPGDLPALYLVGGAVRDHLLSRSPKDIDLVCRDAETFARRVARYCNASFVPFLKKAGEPCFRVVRGKDPNIFIDIALMRGDAITDDLRRRDFTMNAVAIQLGPGGKLGNIIDPLNGISDMRHGLIRIPGPDAFLSDPLRMLRAVRFAAVLGFSIGEGTLSAMKAAAPRLRNTAWERILAELTEIFKTGNSAHFIRMTDELGILEIIFPEIRPMKDCDQNMFHHLDVWRHSLLVLENCEHILSHPEEFFSVAARQVSENLKSRNRLPLLKLAAMLHDVGKPRTRGFREDTGRITFYGHDKKGAEIISEIAGRLRMPKRDQEFIRILVAEHLHTLSLSAPEVRFATQMRWFRKLGEDVIPLIILSMADIMATRGPASGKEFRTRHLDWSAETVNRYFGKIREQLKRSSLISGNDLIARNMIPGPEMGRILRKVREAQDTGKIRNRDEALAMAEALAEK